MRIRIVTVGALAAQFPRNRIVRAPIIRSVGHDLSSLTAPPLAQTLTPASP